MHEQSGIISHQTPDAAPSQGGTDFPYGTYDLNLTLLPGEIYILAFNTVEFATKVYIDGTLLDQIGTVTDHPENFEPVRKFCYYVVSPKQGEIVLTLQYANHYNGYGKPPILTIGKPELMFREQAHSDFIRFTIMAVYLASFILYAGMFLFNRNSKENLYFSLPLFINKSLYSQMVFASGTLLLNVRLL